MRSICWILTIVGVAVGIVVLLMTLDSDSAPKQAAGAATAVAFVVIPYCLARAVEGLTSEKAGGE